MLAAMPTGVANVSVCHPLALSPVNVPVVSNWPLEVHSQPV